MIRGWQRQKHEPSLLPGTNNARRGDYDGWEPLGRLLLPELHRQVDKVLQAGRAARRSPTQKVSTPTPADNSHIQAASTSAEESSTQQSAPETSGEEGQPVSHSGGASAQANTGEALQASPPSDFRPAFSHSVHENSEARDTGTQNATDSTGTSHPATESDNTRVTATETEPLSPPNEAPRTGGAEPNGNTEAEQTVAAYYAEPLPIYSRRPESAWTSPPTYTPRQTEFFCANCDPRSQISNTSLLSDYLCHQCWVDFTLWRSDTSGDGFV